MGMLYYGERLHAATSVDILRRYLTVMSSRLVELRCVLKPTDSLYLHCDPATPRATVTT